MGEISQELAQRMADLIRDLSDDHAKYGAIDIEQEFVARTAAIVAELPQPTAPDLISAREIVARCCLWFSEDDGPDMASRIRNGEWDTSSDLVASALSAITGARELERSGK